MLPPECKMKQRRAPGPDPGFVGNLEYDTEKAQTFILVAEDEELLEPRSGNSWWHVFPGAYSGLDDS